MVILLLFFFIIDGQTGSGKTFTMTGPESNPGLTRRSIAKLFNLVEENASMYKVEISSYFIELYNDNLVDLFYRIDKGEN